MQVVYLVSEELGYGARRTAKAERVIELVATVAPGV